MIWPSDADWMTARMCESATETPIRSRMPAAVLALNVSSGQSAIRRRFGKTHAGGGPVPAGLNADCRGYHHLYRHGAALTARHDLGLARDMAVLGMTWIPECLDSLVIQDDEVRHAAGNARASAHNSTSSGLASGWSAAISTAAWRSRPGCPASGWPSSSAAAIVARTNGASGPGHQAASVAVTAAGRSGRDRTCRCRGAG